MLGPLSQSNPHFSTYYKDNKILIQFMIVEFIETHQLLLQIETLFQNMQGSQQLFLEKELSSLIQMAPFLLQGFSSSHEASSFGWVEGALTKLKMYCEHFCSNAEQKEKKGIELYLALHQTELAVRHSFSLLSSLKRQGIPSEAFSFLSIQRAFASLKMRFNRVIRSFPRLVRDYCHDENILLCLLRKKGALTKIYGSDFLAKSFKCSLSPQELMRLLLKQYQTRGFFSLPPLIQKNLEEVVG